MLSLSADPCRLSPIAAISGYGERLLGFHPSRPWTLSNTLSHRYLRCRTPGLMIIFLSQIADVCRWYAVGWPPTAKRQAATLTELAQITAGRTGLPASARYAGQTVARHDAEPDAAAYE